METDTIKNYNDLIKKHEDEANEFSKDKIYFVFGSTETEIIRKLNQKGVKPEEVTSLGAGGFIKTEYLPEFKELLLRHDNEKHQYTLNNIYEVVQYYCWDYELYISISYDLDSLLTEVVGLTPEEIQENNKEITRAYRDYKREFEKLNI